MSFDGANIISEALTNGFTASGMQSEATMTRDGQESDRQYQR